MTESKFVTILSLIFDHLNLFSWVLFLYWKNIRFFIYVNCFEYSVKRFSCVFVLCSISRQRSSLHLIKAERLEVTRISISYSSKHEPLFNQSRTLTPNTTLVLCYSQWKTTNITTDNILLATFTIKCFFFAAINKKGHTAG